MRKESIQKPNSAQLDAVAAAPDHHRVIFENEHVRVLDTRIEAGDTVPVHTHPWPSVVYTLETSDFVRFDITNGTKLDSREAEISIPLDTPIALPPLTPHSIRNVGERAMRAISVELKNIREK